MDLFWAITSLAGGIIFGLASYYIQLTIKWLPEDFLMQISYSRRSKLEMYLIIRTARIILAAVSIGLFTFSFHLFRLLLPL